MKETIRVVKHKGINVGYCNNCNYKEDVYQIRIGSCEIRLCKKCLEQLLFIVNNTLIDEEIKIGKDI